MADELRVEPAVLRSTCHSLAGAAEHMRSRLQSLDGTVTGMVARWRGLSGGAYGDAWRAWHQGAGEVEKALGIMARLLDSAAEGFEGSERTGASALREVHGG